MIIKDNIKYLYIIADNNLKKDETINLIEETLNNGTNNLKDSQIDKILPPISIFSGKRSKLKNEIYNIFNDYLNKYIELVYTLKFDNNL